MIKNKRELIHSEISEKIIGSCFEVMNELGSGSSISFSDFSSFLAEIPASIKIRSSLTLTKIAFPLLDPARTHTLSNIGVYVSKITSVYRNQGRFAKHSPLESFSSLYKLIDLF